MKAQLRHAILLAVAMCAIASPASAQSKSAKMSLKRKAQSEVIFSYNIPSVKIYSSAVEDTTRLFVISDTHLWLSDEREEPYRENSKRMAAAYNKTSHYATGQPTSPEESLRATVALAKSHKADAIALLGDMVSYPSERGIELVQEIMNESGIAWYYTCGNHDWHYEGMEGDRLTLRNKWQRAIDATLCRPKSQWICGQCQRRTIADSRHLDLRCFARAVGSYQASYSIGQAIYSDDAHSFVCTWPKNYLWHWPPRVGS